MRLEPGQYAAPHSHDLGHEIFIVMQGRAIFEIDGESGELGPGQMCVALADQLHSIQVTSDEPMIMYLSVTPHVVPTHTSWSEDGRRLPYSYGSPGSYDQEPDAAPLPDAVGEFVSTLAAVAAAAGVASEKGLESADSLVQVMEQGDSEAAGRLRDSLWDALFALYTQVDELTAVWNRLAPRADIDSQ